MPRYIFGERERTATRRTRKVHCVDGGIYEEGRLQLAGSWAIAAHTLFPVAFSTLTTLSLADPVLLRVLLFLFPERDGEQDVLGRGHLDHLGARQHVVARAHPAAKLGRPVGHVPLEPVGSNDARLLDGDDANVLVEQDVFVTVTVSCCIPTPASFFFLADVNPVPSLLVAAAVSTTSFQQKGERVLADQEEAAAGVARRARLVEVQVVQLAEPLVDAAAQAAQDDNVEGRIVVVTRMGVDVVDGLAKVGGFLVGVVDDLGL